MISKTIKKIRVIEHQCGEEFERELNEVMANNKVVDFVYNMNKGHCCYVTLEEHITEAEDIRDEMNLKGIYYYCGDCPFYVQSDDRRVKYTRCKCDSHAYYNQPACLYLYEQVAKGEVTIDL